MFTIRLIEQTGHETLIQTKRVCSAPFVDTPGTQVVFYDHEDGSTIMIESGTVYVMNDFGKTVAVYHLPVVNRPPETPGTIPVSTNTVNS